MVQQQLISNFVLKLGPFGVSETLIISWFITLLFLVLAIITRHIIKSHKKLGAWQTIVEDVYSVMEEGIAEILPEHATLVFPFIASLWLFIFVANLIGIIPGLSSPTSDLSITSALAVLVFFSVHWFGIRAEGVRNYFAHYLKPNPILLPFHIMSEITRTLALAIRLFGNIMSVEFAILLVLMIAGLLVPIPLILLHIIEGIIQAYIFGLLALIYIAGGIQSKGDLYSEEKNNQTT
jgi:F-type H+-transporting ATPase subunit a